MQRETFQFGFHDLKIDIQQIERLMGYPEGESHEAVAEMTGRILDDAGNIATIRAEYVVADDVDFNEKEKSLMVAGTDFQLKKIVYGQIKKAESIALFICTAGHAIGEKSRLAMRDGDLLTGYIYDAIGSEIADRAADLMQESLKSAMTAEGKKITNRYSPGYCGWDVGEQHKLFTFFPDNFCGITLTHSALMDPVKSVSGIIGIGSNVKFNAYTCNLCDMRDCIYRKRKA